MNDGLNDLQKVVLKGVNDIMNYLRKTDLNIPQRNMNKILIGLSYELFMADLEEDGLNILRKTSVDYFHNDFKEDMAKDPNFLYVVNTLAKKLKEIGYSLEELDRLYKMKLN